MPEEHAKPTITPDDLFRLQFLQDARLAPDGKTAAYAVARPGEPDETCAIWLLHLESGAARQLTAGTARDNNPAWSPDGKQIAFLSSRGGKSQIYTIAVDGGEARPVTSLEQGAGNGPAWSPDGKLIAFTAVPHVAADPAQPYRVTRHIYRFDAMMYLDDNAQALFVAPAEGGEARQLTQDGCNYAAGVVADSQEILCLVTMFPELHRTRGALRAVGLDGRVRSLVEEWGHAICGAWLPDGRVAFVGNRDGSQNGLREKAWVVALEGGEPECRTSDVPLHIGLSLEPDMPQTALRIPRLLVSPDGQTAFVQAQQGGAVSILSVALHGAERWSRMVSGERACLPASLAAGRLLFSACNLNNPPDLCVVGLDGAGERRLTDLNGAVLGGLAQARAERLAAVGSDGAPVEGWFLHPPAGQAPYPTVLQIHGGPHTAFGNMFSFDEQMLTGAGFGVLLINHRGSTGYGDDFATATKGGWGNLDYKDLMAGVDLAVARGLADPARMGVCGLSGGGNLSCWIVGQTDRFKAAVPQNPVTNWVSFFGVSDIGPHFGQQELGGLPWEIPDVYRRCSPITFAHNCKTPTLLIQGEQDWRCPAEQSEQFYTVLKAVGCTVEMLRLPNSSHTGAINGPIAARMAANQALLEWMQRYVLA